MAGTRYQNRNIRSQRTLIILWAAVLIVSTLAIPTILVKRVKVDLTAPPPIYELPITTQPNEPSVNIPVYLSQQQKVVEVPLELYVRGVVAAEMPADFELEALKAQAIAARTYMVRKIVEQDITSAPDPRAWVTDTVADQAYVTEEELKSRWSTREFAVNISKINRAVAETRGQIIAYDGQPIDATYFSTSNGYTENSEEYWSESVPYLRSVASPWDAEISPKYTAVTRFSVKDVMKRLGLQAVPATSSTGSMLGLAIAEKTSGNRIKTIKINGSSFSGREVREKLGLPSSQFTWTMKGDSIEFTTYGYGHGVGMSQYGAHGMALQGSTAQEILTYYYQDVQIIPMQELAGWREFATPAAGLPTARIS